jgi:hypothetical protein
MKRIDQQAAAPCPKPTKVAAGQPPAKAGAATARKAVARLKHEVRHERPMTEWGKGGKR